ncbi:MAG: adenylate/guanylate cyclase domain-containing protein, partial [Sphingomonas sp.]
MPTQAARDARAADDRIASTRETLRRIGPVRLLGTALFLTLAVLFARGSWSIPLARDVERILYDVRAYASAPTVDQDDRITMVVFNDQTLIETGRRSPLDRVTLAKALQ